MRIVISTRSIVFHKSRNTTRQLLCSHVVVLLGFVRKEKTKSFVDTVEPFGIDGRHYRKAC